jgi:hypothetical protein
MNFMTRTFQIMEINSLTEVCVWCEENMEESVSYGAHCGQIQSADSPKDYTWQFLCTEM